MDPDGKIYLRIHKTEILNQVGNDGANGVFVLCFGECLNIRYLQNIL